MMKKTSEQWAATGRSRKLKVLFADEQVSVIGHEIKGFDSFEASANNTDIGNSRRGHSRGLSLPRLLSIV